MKQVISDSADFPNVKIYREERRGGPLYTVAFWNKEQRGNWVAYVTSLLIVASFAVALYDPERFAMAAILPLPVIVWAVLAMLPYKAWREIELDFANGDLRVKKGGRVTRRKRMGVRKIELAIERHPYAYDEKKQWLAKRLLCLVGYFGLAGADREILITRWEYPPKGSLMEVQAAVLYAWKLGANEHNERVLSSRVPGGRIAPPLE